MAKPIWREGRITKNCRDCGAQTTGYVDTGKEPDALCINCAKAKGLLIDRSESGIEASLPNSARKILTVTSNSVLMVLTLVVVLYLLA